MRLLLLFSGLAALLSVSASTSEEPEILATAAFPEENQFGHVINGEKNSINILVENKSDRNVTLINVAGSFLHPDTDVVVKNTTALAYNVQLIEGVKLSVPYTFHSEFKPGDLRFSVWVEHQVDNQKYRVSAYDSIVTIVEPEISIFDFKLVSTYLMVTAIFGGLVYFAYLSWVPQTKKSRKRAPVSTPVTATATGAGGYQEEWIPEHHLKKTKTGKGKSVAVSSGDELSGSEVNATENKKRKGKK